MNSVTSNNSKCREHLNHYGVTCGGHHLQSNDSLPVKIKFDRKIGISWLTACLFIVGEIAGTGVLALPQSLKSMGWLGVVVMVTICSIAGYCGILLARCWILCEQINPSTSMMKIRDPYSAIANIAYGTIGRLITSISLCIQLFGCAVVYLLISAEMLFQILNQLLPSGSPVTFCQWIIVLAVTLAPISLLGSPVDFWPVAMFAMSSTSVASILIVTSVLFIPRDLLVSETIQFNSTSVLTEVKSLFPSELLDSSTVTWTSFLNGISTVVFVTGGAAVLPTVQSDMKNKSHFVYSVVIAYSLMLAIYLPVAVVGYGYFGETVDVNITLNLEHYAMTPTLVYLIQLLLCTHCYCAFLISINPVNLTFETLIKVEHSFNLKRCISRLSMVTLVVFVAMSLPKFGKLLNLVGAATVTLQSFILPIIFYLKLQSMVNCKNEITCAGCFDGGKVNIASNSVVTKCNKVTLVIILAIAVACGVICTITTTLDLFDDTTFTSPCYLQ